MTLTDYMKKHDLNDAQFAALINVNQSTINRARRGLYTPSAAVIEAIALVTKGAVQPNDFFQVSL